MARGKRAVTEPKAGLMDVIRNGLTFLPDLILSPVFSRLNSEADSIMDKVQARALAMQERLISKLAYTFFFGLAMVFLFLSGLFYLIEYVKMTKTLSFLAIAIVVLLIGFYFKYQDLKQQKGG